MSSREVQIEKLESEKLALQKKIRIAKQKLRTGGDVTRGASLDAKSPLKGTKGQLGSLPEIKADAGARTNAMIFRKPMPGSSNKQTRMFKGDVMTQKLTQEAKNEFKEIEQKNPVMYQAKVDLTVKMKKAQQQEKALENELKRSKERQGKMKDQFKYELELKE